MAATNGGSGEVSLILVNARLNIDAGCGLLHTRVAVLLQSRSLSRDNQSKTKSRNAASLAVYICSRVNMLIL
jgi:hypothetical protein